MTGFDSSGEDICDCLAQDIKVFSEMELVERYSLDGENDWLLLRSGWVFTRTPLWVLVFEVQLTVPGYDW